MMALSTKLTLVMLLLSIILVGVLEAIIYYFNGNLTIVVASLIPSISFCFLVTERLRDSLSKKMNYLQNSVFLNLHYLFKNEIDLWYDKEKGIRLLRTDLERYGKFLIIRLFPTKLLKKLDNFLLLYKKFYGNTIQILSIAKQKSPSIDYHKLALFYYLGFDVYYSKPSKEEEKEIATIAESIEKDQRVSETKALYEKVKKMRQQIYEELEDFLKCNNLKLEKELRL